MITQRVKLIFSAYRKDDFADPEGFIVQLGMVLERYPDEVIRTVSDPLSGVQRRCKFPPSIAEVVEACDAEAASVATRKRYQAMPRPEFKRLAGPLMPQHRATVFVPPDAPQFEAMVERARRPDSNPLDFRSDDGRPGIWVALGWLDDDQPRKAGRGPRQFTTDDLRALYQRNNEAAPAEPEPAEAQG